MHEYLRRNLLAADRGLLPRYTPSDVAIFTVSHDEWCAIYKGGECHCDPEITLTGSDGSFQILANGDVVKTK